MFKVLLYLLGEGVSEVVITHNYTCIPLTPTYKYARAHMQSLEDKYRSLDSVIQSELD